MMMSCREVSTYVSKGELPGAPLLRRAEAWLHLTMCRYCRRFWKQIRTVDRGMQAAIERMGQEAPADFEERVARRTGEAAAIDLTSRPQEPL